MKRFVASCFAIVMALSLVACGANGNTQPADQGTTDASVEGPASANSLEEILQRAEAVFSDTSAKLASEQEAMFSEVGESYDDYLANIDKVQAWYDLAISETEQLGARAVEYGREYYKTVVEKVDVTDDRELEKATEEYYDTIYDDAFDDYYDAVYDDAFEEMYDKYYDGIIQDAYDVTPYGDWSDVRSDAYKAWSDARSDVYKAWSDARSDVYGDYTDVRSAFYQNDFDVEGLFAPVKVKEDGSSPADEEQATENEATSADSNTSSDSQDFKATMDAYESFMNEYCDFMEKYENSDDTAGMLADYADMMSQYGEWVDKIDDIDEDSLSADDLAYYTQINARVLQRLGEIGQ